MYRYNYTLRVRYAETDQMAYVYYGNYATYYEVARVEALRSLGLSYRKMEEEGIMLPVLNLKIDFLKPARYDEQLTITVSIPEMPRARIFFTYSIENESGECINRGETWLVFVNKHTGRPCKPPAYLLEALKIHF